MTWARSALWTNRVWKSKLDSTISGHSFLCLLACSPMFCFIRTITNIWEIVRFDIGSSKKGVLQMRAPRRAGSFSYSIHAWFIGLKVFSNRVWILFCQYVIAKFAKEIQSFSGAISNHVLGLWTQCKKSQLPRSSCLQSTFFDDPIFSYLSGSSP